MGSPQAAWSSHGSCPCVLLGQVHARTGARTHGRTNARVHESMGAREHRCTQHMGTTITWGAAVAQTAGRATPPHMCMHVHGPAACQPTASVPDLPKCGPTCGPNFPDHAHLRARNLLQVGGRGGDCSHQELRVHEREALVRATRTALCMHTGPHTLLCACTQGHTHSSVHARRATRTALCIHAGPRSPCHAWIQGCHPPCCAGTQAAPAPACLPRTAAAAAPAPAARAAQ